jgi:hypothetical protein
MFVEFSDEDAQGWRVIGRKHGDIPGCIMLPPAPPERSIQQMKDETTAFHRRVQAYLHGKIGYERVW